jgi:hypothetical protein
MEDLNAIEQAPLEQSSALMNMRAGKYRDMKPLVDIEVLGVNVNVTAA